MTREAREAAVAGGETPLEYMLRIMRDPSQENARRDDMAKAAVGYVHSKLAAVDATLQANVDGSVTFTWLPADKSGDDLSAPVWPDNGK